MKLLKRRRRMVLCVMCAGTGWRYKGAQYVRCPECEGTGEFESREEA